MDKAIPCSQRQRPVRNAKLGYPGRQRGMKHAQTEPEEHAQTEHGACADRARGAGRDRGSRRAWAPDFLPREPPPTSLSTTAAVRYLVRVSVFMPNSDKKRAELREQDKASESK